MGCALPSSVPSATGQTFGSTGVLNLTHLWQGCVWGVCFRGIHAGLRGSSDSIPLGARRGAGINSVSSASVASAPYQILARETGIHNRKSLQQMTPKVGYAYGWFGSTPTPQLTRHLGFNRSYTQWKLTP